MNHYLGSLAIKGLVLVSIWSMFSFGLSAEEPIKVLVWDEQQPKQKSAYPNFLGNQIADQLKKIKGLKVSTASINDPEQGLSTQALNNADVLVWWGHVRHHEISEAKGKEIIDRVKAGKLAFIVLHSAHWAVPFMEAMEQKAIEDALAMLPKDMRKKTKVEWINKRKRKTPPMDKRNTFKIHYIKAKDGNLLLKMERPHCVFPSCCHPAEPSQIRVRLKKHPIVKGIPPKFTIPQTEMYDEPFGVPEPDLLIFDEIWKDGEYFRSGALWNVGAGQVFYFRPGHETYKIFFEKYPLKIMENAVTWMGAQVKKHNKKQQ